MAEVFAVSVQKEGFGAMQAITTPQTFEKVVKGAMRYAGNGLRREAIKNIGQRYALTASRIGQDVGPVRYDRDEVSIVFGRKGPTLLSYGAKPIRGGGLSFKVFREGGVQRRPPGTYFWITTKTGQTLPFKRIGPARKNIQVLFGPSVGSIFARGSKYGDEIRTATLDYFQQQTMTGIDRKIRSLEKGFG